MHRVDAKPYTSILLGDFMTKLLLAKRGTLFIVAGSLALFSTTSMAQKAVVRAPAPPLTSVRIEYVQSNVCGRENIAQNQLATNCNHSNAGLRVSVLEIGYAYGPQAKYANTNLPSSAKIADEPICTTSGAACSAGQTVIGFRKVYSLVGRPDQGQFFFQNQSPGYPVRSTSVYIQ